MIRFYCEKCDSYFRGGAEDNCCPICGSTEIIIHSVR